MSKDIPSFRDVRGILKPWLEHQGADMSEAEASIYDEPVAANTIASLLAGVERRRLNGKLTTLESFIPHLVKEIERLRHTKDTP